MSPCLVINDYSFFFMKISIIGNIFYLVTIWMMYALLKTDVMNPKSTTIFECVNITNLPSFNMTNRCLKMPEIGSNVECQEGFWSVTDNFQQRANVSLDKIFLITVCPIGYDQWYYLFIMLMIITSFFLIGFLSTYFLHQYSWHLPSLFSAVSLSTVGCNYFSSWAMSLLPHPPPYQEQHWDESMT